MGWSEFSEAQIGLNMLVWGAQILYITSFIPQIRENIRLRSELGISNFYIFGELNSYMFLFFDIVCNGFPWPYFVTVVIQLIGTGILIFQRFKYDTFPPGTKKRQLVFYLCNVSFALSLIPIAIKHPHEVGEAASWFAALLCSVAFIPQVYKIYKSRSVKGFSFYAITMFAIANMFELYLCFALHLPTSYFFYTIQNVVFYFIFSSQFMKYSRPKEGLH